MKKLFKGEHGHVLVLVLALIALGLGSVLVTPYLHSVSTNLLASRYYSEDVSEQNALDAGIEDTIWNLLYGDFDTTVLTANGDSTIYSLDDPVNGISPQITVTRSDSSIASDDFESGDSSGGTGWINDWSTSEDAGDSDSVTGISSAGDTLFIVDKLDQQISKFDTSGEFRGSFSLVSANSNPEGITTDGNTIWVVNDSGNKVFSYDLSGTLLGSFGVFGGNNSPGGITTDGNTIWVVNETDNKVFSYETSGNLLGNFNLASGNNDSKGITIDGSTILVADKDGEVFQYDISGSFLGSFSLASGNDNPEGITIDGSIMLVVDKDGEVFQYDTSGSFLGSFSLASSTDDTQVVTTGQPQEGSYHLQLTGSSGFATRTVDVSGESTLSLQFWAKVDSFEVGDEAELQISTDGVTWTTVKTWTSADSDGTYQFFDIDLSSYLPSDQIWIAFDAEMSGEDDFLYIDDLYLIDSINYEITADTGDDAIQATVSIENDDVVVVTWIDDIFDDSIGGGGGTVGEVEDFFGVVNISGASGGTLEGTIYGPLGTLGLSGNTWEVTGQIIGQRILYTGNGWIIQSSIPAPGFLVFADDESAGSTNVLDWSGGTKTVYGDIHSNSDIVISGSNNIATGLAEAVLGFNISGTGNTFGSQDPAAVVLPMPINLYPPEDFFTPYQFEFTGDVNLKEIDAVWLDLPEKTQLKDGVYFATGTLTLSGQGITGNVTLIGDKVSVTANSITLTAFANDVVIYATGTDD